MSTNPGGQVGQRRARPTGSARAPLANRRVPVAALADRSQRALATRAEIVGAARRVFEEMGFGGARMDDVAKAAGVSRPLLYHYFPSKRDLFVEIGRESAIAFREVVSVLRSIPDRWVAADLERMARAFLRYMDGHGSVVSTWSHATWNDQELRDLGVAGQLRSFSVIGAELARLRGGAGIPPMQEGMVVLGMIERLWYYSRVGGAAITDDELVSAITHELALLLRL